MRDLLCDPPVAGWGRTAVTERSARFEYDVGEEVLVALEVCGLGIGDEYTRRYVLRRINDDGDSWEELATVKHKADLEMLLVDAMRTIPIANPPEIPRVTFNE